VANTATKPEPRVPEPRLEIAQCFLRLSGWRSNALSRRMQTSWQQIAGIPPIVGIER
jgi:hypothetical protein